MQQQSQSAEKKSYEAPAVVSLGTVEEMTQGVKGGNGSCIYLVRE